MTLDQGSLDDIAVRLNRGGANYSVFLRLYRCSDERGPIDLDRALRLSMGNGVQVGGVEDLDVAAVAAEVDGMLRYGGDVNAGPDPQVLVSEEFRTLLAGLADEVSALGKRALAIKRFWLSSGHPAYPVFWDFAYAFLEERSATILIGSSSD
jgi:hypothetical protein